MDSILIVDDERAFAKHSRGNGDEGFVADAVSTGEECLKHSGDELTAAFCSTSGCLGSIGLETLKQLRASGSEAAVVIISGHGNMKLPCVPLNWSIRLHRKPLSIEKTVLTVRNALRQQRLD